MVSFLAGPLAKTINRAFKNIFLDATLTRDGTNSGSAYDPSVAAPTVYTCKAITQDDGKGVQGTNLEGQTFATILILAKSLAVTPEPLDRIAIPSQGVAGAVYGGATGNRAITSDSAGATWLVRVVT